MKKTAAVSLSLVLLFLSVFGASARVEKETTVALDDPDLPGVTVVEEPPADMVEFAEGKYNSISSVFKSAPQQWGFKSAEQFDDICFGTAYRVYFPGENAKYASGNSFEEIVDMNDNRKWLFTMDSDGKPMAIMQFECDGDKYSLWKYMGYNDEMVQAFKLARETAKEKNLTLTNKLFSNGPDLLFVLEGDETLFVPVVYDGSPFVADMKAVIEGIKSQNKAYEEQLKYEGETLYGDIGLVARIRIATENPQSFNVRATVIIAVSAALAVGAGVFFIVKLKRKKAVAKPLSS